MRQAPTTTILLLLLCVIPLDPGRTGVAGVPVARLEARVADGGLHLKATIHGFNVLNNGFLWSEADVPAFVEILSSSGQPVRRIALGADVTSSPDPSLRLTESAHVFGVGRHLFLGRERPPGDAGNVGFVPVNLQPGELRLRVTYTRRMLLIPRSISAADQADFSFRWRHPSSLETVLTSNEVVVTIPAQSRRPVANPLAGLEEPAAEELSPVRLEVTAVIDGQNEVGSNAISLAHGSRIRVIIENVGSDTIVVNKPYLGFQDVARIRVCEVGGGATLGDPIASDIADEFFGGGDANIKLPPGGILILTEPIRPLSNGLLDNRGRRVKIDPGRYAIVVEILDGLTASKGTLPTGRVLGKSDSIPITLIEGTQAGNNP